MGWKIHQGQTGLWVVSNGSMFDKNSTFKYFKTKKSGRIFLSQTKGGENGKIY